MVYTLHSTFRNPVRKVSDRESKFRLETEGWGTFTIYAKVVLKNKEEIPLEHELETICKHRGKNSQDVLLIDDLRLYEDGPFGSGSWPGRHEFGTKGIGFIHQLFDETHFITRDFRDEGYLMIAPKTA